MELRVGGLVVFVDPVGKQHTALLTAIWGSPSLENPPCVNVVFVSNDGSKGDSYGRQIERQTSVVYRTRQPAHGMYYMLPGETPNPVAHLQA